MTDNKNNYGVITEQGDMGLGFNPISEKETIIIKENEKSKDKKED